MEWLKSLEKLKKEEEMNDLTGTGTRGLLAFSIAPQPVGIQTNKQTPWSESARQLYRPSDRRLSAK
jgi:hypothetical protein